MVVPSSSSLRGLERYGGSLLLFFLETFQGASHEGSIDWRTAGSQDWRIAGLEPVVSAGQSRKRGGFKDFRIGGPEGKARLFRGPITKGGGIGELKDRRTKATLSGGPSTKGRGIGGLKDWRTKTSLSRRPITKARGIGGLSRFED